MSHLRSAFTLVIALLLITACAGREERAVAAREAARAAISSGDRREALAQILELRENLPDGADWSMQLASLLVAAGEAPQAVWVLEELEQRYPERDDVRMALGRAALLVNDMTMASEAFARIDPGSEHHPASLLMLAQARLGLGDLEGALEKYDEAERLYPDLARARHARVITLLTEGRKEAALEALEAIEIGEDEPLEARKRFAFLAVRVHREFKDFDSAIAVLEPLLADDPSDAQVWAQLLPIYVRTEQLEAKLPEIERLVEERPDQAVRHALLLQVYQELDRPEQVETERAKLLELAESPSIFRSIALTYSVGADREEVTQLIADGLERFPDDSFLRRADIELAVERGALEAASEKIDRYSELLREDHPLIDYLRARVELAAGDVEAARRRLEKLVALLDTSGVQYWLGRALEMSGDEIGAARRYQLSVQRDRNEVAPYEGLIRLAERRGNWEAVGRQAQALLMRHPEHIRGQDALLTSLIHLDRLDDAQKAAEAFVERSPDSVEARLMLARALAAQDKGEEASAALAEAREKFGDLPEIERERALSLAFSGDVDEAIAMVEAGLEAEPESAELQARLAALAFAKGDTARGSAAADRALALDPDDPLPLRVRGIYLASIGAYDRASSDLERFLEQRPRAADVWYTLGLVRAALGETEGSMEAYRLCIALDQRNHAAHNNLALALARSGRLDEAVASAQTAYRLAEDAPNVIDTLGWLYLEQGLVERAVSLLERAHQLAPQQEDVQYHLALAYRQSDRDEDARRLLEALRARIPETHRLYAQTDEALRSLP